MCTCIHIHKHDTGIASGPAPYADTPIATDVQMHTYIRKDDTGIASGPPPHADTPIATDVQMHTYIRKHDTGIASGPPPHACTYIRTAHIYIHSAPPRTHPAYTLYVYTYTYIHTAPPGTHPAGGCPWPAPATGPPEYMDMCMDMCAHWPAPATGAPDDARAEHVFMRIQQV